MYGRVKTKYALRIKSRKTEINKWVGIVIIRNLQEIKW